MPRVKPPAPIPISQLQTAYGPVLVYCDNERPQFQGSNNSYLFHDVVFKALEVLADLRDDDRRGRRRLQFAQVRNSAVKLADLVRPLLSKSINNQTLVRRCRFALKLYGEATRDDSVRSPYLFAV